MGRNLALILTPIAFWVAVTIWQGWRKSNSSPDAGDPSQGGVKPQVTSGVMTPALPRGRGVAESSGTPSDMPSTDVATTPGPRNEIVAWLAQRAGDGKPTELIRAAASAHRVSHSTAKRAWSAARRLRGRDGGPQVPDQPGSGQRDRSAG